MNFKAMQKRSSKPAERGEKVSDIKGKLVRKFKRKRRYGKTCSRRAPGKFNTLLEQKAKQYNVAVTEVDIQKYKASQYDHTTGEYRKPVLSERGKKIGGKRVQRDLYSSFLLKNYKNLEMPDKDKCSKEFKLFLKQQGKVVSEVKKHGDTTGNFGLKLFA